MENRNRNAAAAMKNKYQHVPNSRGVIAFLAEIEAIKLGIDALGLQFAS